MQALASGLTILSIVSCGGSDKGSLSAELRPHPGLQSPGQLMAQLSVSGIAVDAGYYKQGAAYDTQLPNNLVAEAGPAAVFNPLATGGANDMAYACYAFDAAAYEGPAGAYLDWNTTPEAGHSWLGLGNFDANRWDLFPLDASQTAALETLEPYLNEAGLLLAAVIVDGGAPATLDAIGLGAAAQLSLLEAIPAELVGFPGPISYALPATEEAGERAGRLWMDAGETNLVVVQLSDELSAEDALAAYIEQCAAYGAAATVGDGGFMSQDNQLGGTEGFNLLQFTRGPYLALVGSGVMAPGAAPLSQAVLSELAVDLALSELAGEAHAASRAPSSIEADYSFNISAALSDWPAQGDCDCGADSAGLRQVSETTSTSVSMDLEKPAGTKVGTITLTLKITPTEEPCGQMGTDFMTIVDVYVESITLEPGADDGDGAGRGAGDMMVGGNVSIGFLGLGGMTSVAMGGFATGEVGDIAEGGSSSDDEDTELPKFVGQVKGCGVPKVIDVDLLLRDNDAGTDVQDIVAAAAAAAGEYGAGTETGKRVGAAVDGMGEKASDASGTDGMKLVRDRDKDGKDEPGDDVGEAHDKQTEIPGQ
jgi:hypothetical protein